MCFVLSVLECLNLYKHLIRDGLLPECTASPFVSSHVLRIYGSEFQSVDRKSVV